jgi:hypothetical protein
MDPWRPEAAAMVTHAAGGAAIKVKGRKTYDPEVS